MNKSKLTKSVMAISLVLTLLISSVQLNVTHLYAADNYTITASVSGGHGSVSPASQLVNSGENAAINITPDTGYHIVSITDNSYSVNVANPYIISNLLADHAVVVTFAIDTLGIGSGTNPHGSINPDGMTIINYGGSETFTITRDDGYSIENVWVDGVSVLDQLIDDSYIFENVTSGHLIFANFTPVLPSVTVSPSNQSVDNGASFTVYVAIDTPAAIRGWQTDIEFDASKVQCNSVTMGDFLLSFAEEHEGSTSPMYGVRDNTAGKITLINNAIMGASDSGGPSGTGTLCILAFTANQDINGVCVITPTNVILVDSQLNEIPVILVDSGSVAIGNTQRMMSSTRSKNTQVNSSTVVAKPISIPPSTLKSSLVVDPGPMATDIVSEIDAQKAALYYMSVFSQKDGFSDWKEASASLPVNYNAPDMSLSAYEFTVLNKGQPAGYILISARKDWSPVLEFGKGPAPSSHLNEAKQTGVLDNYLSQNDVSQPILFYWGALSYSAQIGDKMKNDRAVIGLGDGKIRQLPSAQSKLQMNDSQSRETWAKIGQAVSILPQAPIPTQSSVNILPENTADADDTSKGATGESSMLTTTYLVLAGVTGGYGGPHGSVSPTNQYWNAGDNAAVTCIPDAGYQVASITDKDYYGNITHLDVTQNPIIISNIQCNHTIEVFFGVPANPDPHPGPLMYVNQIEERNSMPAWTESDSGGGSIQWPNCRGIGQDPWANWDGCTPISASMVVKYWQNRFPNVFPNIGKFTLNGTSYTDNDKDALIDDLHKKMKTNDASNGRTWPWDNPKVWDALDLYGYGSQFDVQINPPLVSSIAWSDVTHEIDASRPFILTLWDGDFQHMVNGFYRSEDYQHSVAVWGYDSVTYLGGQNQFMACCSTWKNNDYEDVYVHFGDWVFQGATLTKVMPICSLTMAVNGSGTINPGAGKYNYHYGDKIDLTAVPNTGCSFICWNISGNGTIQNSATTTVTLNGDCTVSAVFSNSSSPTVGMEIEPMNKLDLLKAWFISKLRWLLRISPDSK